MKSGQIWSSFWSVSFCIRTDYGDLLVNLRIQSDYRKTRTRNKSAFGHFSRSETVYLGKWNLDLTETIMYKFHYDYIKLKYGNNFKLFRMDIDS